MATRSEIFVRMSNGRLGVVYCHYDGYPEHHMPILTEHYNSQEMAEKLIALGALSVLDNSPECPESHSFETPVRGYCIAYGRDRGEEGQEARTDVCVKVREDYAYYWDGNNWSVVCE